MYGTVPDNFPFSNEFCRQEADVVPAGLKPARTHLVLRVRRKDHLKRDVVDFHAFQARQALQGLCEPTGKPPPISGNREFCGWECRPQQDNWSFIQRPKDVEDAQAEPVHNAPAVAATTCSQWRRDARVLGSPSLCTHWGLWAPSLGAIPTLVREYLLVASGSWASVSLGCQPGVRVVSFIAWSVLVSPPFFLAEVTLFQRGTASDNTLDQTSQHNNVGVHPCKGVHVSGQGR